MTAPELASLTDTELVFKLRHASEGWPWTSAVWEAALAEIRRRASLAAGTALEVVGLPDQELEDLLHATRRQLADLDAENHRRILERKAFPVGALIEFGSSRRQRGRVVKRSVRYGAEVAYQVVNIRRDGTEGEKRSVSDYDRPTLLQEIYQEAEK